MDRPYIVLTSFGIPMDKALLSTPDLLHLRTEQLASQGSHLFNGMLIIAAKVWEFVPNTIKE